MKVLIAGWFSFEQMGASAGDLICRDLVSGWLSSAGIEPVVAVAPPFQDGVRWESVAPASIDAVIFLCGPFGNGWPIPEFLQHFAGKRLLGFNLTMLQRLDEWNPFDVLWERDSSRMCRPDAVFLAPPLRVPVAGVVLVHPQAEYGERGRHNEANAALRQALRTRGLAPVEIDTRLDLNATGLETPAQVESLIARMDVVLTTRLHGMVLALKNSVPCLVIDPIAGGAKIVRQAEAIGWEHVYQADLLDPTQLLRSLDVCLSPQGKAQAANGAEKARASLSDIGLQLVRAVQEDLV